jgi:hypothetical protein
MRSYHVPEKTPSASREKFAHSLREIRDAVARRSRSVALAQRRLTRAGAASRLASERVACRCASKVLR